MGREQKMIFYFDQLLRDYRRPFDWKGRSMEKWRLIGDMTIQRQMLHYTLAIILVVWFMLYAVFNWENWAVILIFSISLVGYVVALVSFKNKEKGYRTGPGLMRRYRVSMADAVDRVYKALEARKGEFDVFGITLTDWSNRPRATIFAMEDIGVLITVWKEGDDPYYTIVHIGPYTISRQEEVDFVKILLDAFVPDRA